MESNTMESNAMKSNTIKLGCYEKIRKTIEKSYNTICIVLYLQTMSSLDIVWIPTGRIDHQQCANEIH